MYINIFNINLNRAKIIFIFIIITAILFSITAFANLLLDFSKRNKGKLTTLGKIDRLLSIITIIISLILLIYLYYTLYNGNYYCSALTGVVINSFNLIILEFVIFKIILCSIRNSYYILYI